MKKLATFVLVLCLGAFTIGSVAGCGGKDEKDKKADAKDGAKDEAKDGAKDEAKDEAKDSTS
jgi:hypothetical protein